MLDPALLLGLARPQSSPVAGSEPEDVREASGLEPQGIADCPLTLDELKQRYEDQRPFFAPVTGVGDDGIVVDLGEVAGVSDHPFLVEAPLPASSLEWRNGLQGLAGSELLFWVRALDPFSGKALLVTRTGWPLLRKRMLDGQVVKGRVTEAFPTWLRLDVHGVPCDLPVSQMAEWDGRVDSISDLFASLHGETIRVRVIDLLRSGKDPTWLTTTRLDFNRQAAQEALDQLRESCATGQRVKVEVIGTTPKGLTGSLNGVGLHVPGGTLVRAAQTRARGSRLASTMLPGYIGRELSIVVTRFEADGDVHGRIMAAERVAPDTQRRIIDWDEIERLYRSGEPVKAVAVEATNSGLHAYVCGVSGFASWSRLDNMPSNRKQRAAELRDRVGRLMRFKVIRVDKLQEQITLPKQAAIELAESGNDADSAPPRHDEAKLSWDELRQRYKKGAIFEARITGSNKDGLLVDVEGIDAVVPLSQIVEIEGDREQAVEQLQAYAGRYLRVKAIQVNRNRAILSERAAAEQWQAGQKDRLLNELREGEIRSGKITAINSFGMFVDLGGADGLADPSEISWEQGIDPEEMFSIGQTINVYVMKVDKEYKKIGLSIRRAAPGEWDKVVAKFTVGQVVAATVTKLVTFGAFARIEGLVEGLVPVSELVDRGLSHPRDVVVEGQVIPVKIVRIDQEQRSVSLSLKQAREEAEQAGWVFNEEGGVERGSNEISGDDGDDESDASNTSPTALGAAMRRAGVSGDGDDER